MSNSIYWYDYETFGTDPRYDRLAQFAGLRTDEQLNVISDPLVMYCKPANDMLPDPMACMVTGITPQKARAEGLIEAEFIAAVQAGKICKYLRSVLDEFGFPQDGPTTIYEDNQAAVAMVNENKPTPRSRHIDIQHFAIQEWRQRGILQLQCLPGVINPVDQATKALGWTLLSRHAR